MKFKYNPAVFSLVVDISEILLLVALVLFCAVHPA